jgi:DNA-binding NarL/FixJ family response regulator
MNPIRVFLVDDEELLIESLEIILTIKGKMQVVGKAGDGKEALSQLTNTVADIALVDLNMKGMGGIELIPLLKQRYPAMKILVLTTFYDDDYITNSISNGADGYLLKDSEEDHLISAIHQILTGQSILDSKVMKVLSKRMAAASQRNDTEKSHNDRQLPTDLTTREMELCSLITEGYTNSEIAGMLYISEGTVKNYMSSIYDKFDLHDRTQLAILLKGIL